MKDFDPGSTSGGLILKSAAEIFSRANVQPTKDDLKAAKLFPAKSTKYYLDLAAKVGPPLLKQVLPSGDELHSSFGEESDSLGEDEQSPAPCVIHRYPDRCLLLASNECAMYCRFCTRKRKVGKKSMDCSYDSLKLGLEYIKKTETIRDVIISGGDPLVMPLDKLEWILGSLRQIDHVEMIRIGTRVPCVWPQRVTNQLTNILKHYAPLFLSVHFEHPEEVTNEAGEALLKLAAAGCQLGNQSVLLKGVNDDPMIMRELSRRLLKYGCRFYYLYACDMAPGLGHFRAPVETGLRIIKDGLRGWTSGLGVPQFVIDAPHGKGKCPLLPEYCKLQDDGTVELTNYLNEKSSY